MLVSIVLPVYRSKDFIFEMYQQIISLPLEVEIIFVDDGCPQNSWNEIRKITHDKRVVGIKLSKNFGQHFAITAGLEAAKGDYTIVMDCDLQEDPADIPKLLEALNNNSSDIVLTLRKKRSFGIKKNFQAQAFYRMMGFLGAKNEFSERVGTFSCLSRRVVCQYLKYKDVHRHYLMIVKDLGFKKTYVEIIHRERKSGTSSYSFLKLLRHSLDGLAFQSNRLLKVSILIGSIFILMSLLLSTRILWLYFTQGSVAGYTSLILSIFLCSGVILFTLGVHGIYIGKIFDQARDRPLYIIEEKLNGE